MLTRARPGLDHLAMHRPEVATYRGFRLESPAFETARLLPERYTSDGLGVSPALEWKGAPEQTSSLALIMADADSPSREPLVHAIAWVIGRSHGGIREGALNPSSDWALPTLGRNSYLRPRYLAPDPPPGHGPHRYVFQLFALDCSLH